jgi:hypothetical protein
VLLVGSGKRFCLLHNLNDPASLTFKICVKKLLEFYNAVIHYQNLTFSPTAPYVRNVQGGEKMKLMLNSRATKFTMHFSESVVLDHLDHDISMKISKIS